MALTNGTAEVTPTYETDASGVPNGLLTDPQPFGFNGEQRDAENGLVYVRARVYDLQTGRVAPVRYRSVRKWDSQS
jgi:RHS repeat-associated protein